MSDNLVTGEVSSSKLAAAFASRTAARAAADALVAHTDVTSAQVRLVEPDEPDIGIKLEPEGGNIWRTIVLAHARLGVLGAVAGLIVFAILALQGVRFVTSSPWAAGGAFVFFGTTAGLFLGGLVSLRPDHARYIDAARAAQADGRTTVVVHALSAEQRSRAADFLSGRGGEVTQTF